MAIRFLCGSCTQPIEIDDEWASNQVACPYCRKTVTAPATSTLDATGVVPSASEATFGQLEHSALPHSPANSRGPGPAHQNRLAVVAFILMVLSVASLIAAELVLAPHMEELEPVLRSVQDAKSFGDISRAQAEFFDAYEVLPGWYLASVVLQATSALAWLAAVTCGIIAVLRQHRRPLAVTTLVIAGLVPVFFCCGGFLGLGIETALMFR